MLEVGVYNVPELSTKARIGSGGDIYLPLIDYVHVAGLTLDEAQELIEKKLSDGGFVKNPHVSIFVDESASQGASVLGEVMKPGVYPVLGQQHLFDVISAAGGLTDKAGRSLTVTHRSEPNKPVTVALARNLNDKPETNIVVSPGDTIVVRKADVVYVVGDVARPSGLLIDRGSLTVMQAIALAGGTTRTSRLNGTRIIHKGPDGMTETHVPLKKILEAKAPDVSDESRRYPVYPEQYPQTRSAGQCVRRNAGSLPGSCNGPLSSSKLFDNSRLEEFSRRSCPPSRAR